MPVAVFAMACILYTYSVTSIQAAKRNAKLHREADGGQLDMRKESLRRHGMLDKVEGTTGVQLFREARAAESKEETAAMGNNKAQPPGTPILEEQGAPRTKVEGSLEEYKGVGAAVKKFKETQNE